MSDLISRRMFLGGASALLALPKSAWAGLGQPRLRFGVVSDIHVSRYSVQPETYAYGNSTTFKTALEYFRDHGADAVVCAGDMSDRGVTSTLDICREVWKEVFPDNKAPDGRPVEPIFVYGNHDSDKGWFDRASGMLRGKSEAEAEAIKANSISRNESCAWEHAFGEKWAPVYLKRVKGYAFVGAHWGHERELGDFLDAHRAELKGNLPFFEVQHPHPRGTLYGKYTWGEDGGVSTRTLSSFPNAVSFSGHSHASVALEASVWQGAFTAIGCSSLSYQTLFERKGVLNADGNRGRYPTASSRSREGMLVSVYDGCLVIERREFVRNESLGPDWVIPLPLDPSHGTFTRDAVCRRLAAPAFPQEARLTVVRRGEFLEIEVPSAIYAPDRTRTVWYELAVRREGEAKPVYAAGLVANEFFAPFGKTPAGMTFKVSPKELGGAGKVRLAVTARDLFDRVSAALTCGATV